MQKLHEWYYLAYVYGLNFIETKIPEDIFNTLSFDDCLVHVSVINIF
jgi:hypothetical protein